MGGSTVVRVLLLVAVLVAFYGCGQSSPTLEQAEKRKDPEQLPVNENKPETTGRGTFAHTASEQASVEAAKVADADSAEATRSPAASASARVDAEYFRKNCRIQTYIAERDMSATEVEAFAADMRAFLVEDIEAGDYPTVEDYLDKEGVPEYEHRCGRE